VGIQRSEAAVHVPRLQEKAQDMRDLCGRSVPLGRPVVEYALLILRQPDIYVL